MQLMRSLSSRFSSMSVKVEEFRIKKHGANEFAEYKITVWEGSSQYSVWRRWSDLKEAYEALEKEHAKEMKKKQIPAFEAHSMRLGAAHPPKDTGLLTLLRRIVAWVVYPGVFAYIFFVWIPLRSVPRW